MQQTAHIRSVSHSATLHYPPDLPPHIASIITGRLEEGIAGGRAGGGSAFILVFILLFYYRCAPPYKSCQGPVGVKDEVCAAYKLKTLSDRKGEMQSWIKEVWKRVRSVKSE